jgi:tellurite resistance protein TehA-like permease
MVLEMLLEFLRGLTQVNTVLLLGVFLVFIVLAYKIFQALIKAFIVGVIAATFPVVASLMGMNVPLTISNVIWFAILGVVAYLLYATISGGAKIIGLVLRPFRGLFTKKPVQKVIIREKENAK